MSVVMIKRKNNSFLHVYFVGKLYFFCESCSLGSCYEDLLALLEAPDLSQPVYVFMYYPYVEYIVFMLRVYYTSVFMKK